MYIAIVGSRDYPKLTQVDVVVRSIAIKYPDATIVSGAARGVDRRAAVRAKEAGLNVIEYEADWSQGRGAGFARNKHIIDRANFVIAFWDGRSRGTRHSIMTALRSGKEVHLFWSDGGWESVSTLEAFDLLCKEQP